MYMYVHTHTHTHTLNTEHTFSLMVFLVILALLRNWSRDPDVMYSVMNTSCEGVRVVSGEGVRVVRGDGVWV